MLIALGSSFLFYVDVVATFFAACSESITHFTKVIGSPTPPNFSVLFDHIRLDELYQLEAVYCETLRASYVIL